MLSSILVNGFLQYFLASLLSEASRASGVAGMDIKHFLASLLSEASRASGVAGMDIKHLVSAPTKRRKTFCA
jgi:hypothetical protein